MYVIFNTSPQLTILVTDSGHSSSITKSLHVVLVIDNSETTDGQCAGLFVYIREETVLHQFVIAVLLLLTIARQRHTLLSGW